VALSTANHQQYFSYSGRQICNVEHHNPNPNPVFSPEIPKCFFYCMSNMSLKMTFL